MTAQWTSRDYERMRQVLSFFTDAQSSRMGATFEGNGCVQIEVEG